MFKTYNINLSLFKSLIGLLNNLNSFIVDIYKGIIWNLKRKQKI